MNSHDKDLLHRVQMLVNEKYPGIALESAVQGWAYLGDFDAGVQAYRSLIEPGAKDDRWFGVCLFQRFEDMLAQEAFFRALSKGEEAARVNLAHLLRFLERSEEAVTELTQVNVETLNPYDVVLYLRVSSLHEETNGNIRKAVEFAEHAWQEVQGIPEFNILAPGVLAQLGILYGRTGEARRALWYLEHGIKLTTGFERQKVQLRRATLLINLGRLDEAEAELRSLSDIAEGLNLERMLLEGELNWMAGNLETAVDRFLTVVQAAATAAAGSEEMTARISLAAILTYSNQYVEAQENLDKATILRSDRIDVLVHRFREILLHLKRGQYIVSEAISELEMLAVELRRLGTLQEEASVRLHIAELLRLTNHVRCISELQNVADICALVQNSIFLQKEWHFVPELKAVARSTIPTLFAPRSQLEVISIGEEQLKLNGRIVQPPLKRTVELLTYFLENHSVALGNLLKDVFPNVKARTGRSYFHQFRHQIKQHVPGLKIIFNSANRRYELRTTIDIRWDVTSLRAGEQPVLNGEFLPYTSPQWSKELREEVRSLLKREVEVFG